MRRLYIIPLLFGWIGWLVLGAPATAHTPEVGSVNHCDVAPRTVDGLAGLAARATPSTGEQSAPHVIAEADLPVGEPADAITVEEITGLLEMRAACVRDLNFARVYALYTERYLVELFSVEMLPDLDALTATPYPRPDYRFGSIAQATLLADGRVSAFVTYIGADIEDDYPRTGVTYLMIFEKVDGVWRIDRQYERYIDTVAQQIRPIAELMDEGATPAA